MTARFDALCIHANDPAALAHFYAGVLGRVTADDPYAVVALLPNDDVEFRIRFLATTAAKTGQNRAHFDLTSATPEAQEETVARALELGARHLDIGQGPDASNVVLTDPEGNELDVIEAGNNFLAGCGVIGAVASDGTPEVGRFWSAALDWPLVWDQDEETAIQSPRGGTKITWGGPPYMPRVGREWLTYDLVTDDPSGDTQRLVELGAKRLGDGLLADPDGNEFRLLLSGAGGGDRTP